MKHALRFCLLLLAISPFVMCVVGELGLSLSRSRHRFTAMDEPTPPRKSPKPNPANQPPDGDGRLPVAMGPPIADNYGDPLPIGATLRMGTERFRVHGGGFALSPNGKILALGRKHSIHLCSVPSGDPIHDLGNGDSPQLLRFSPDNRFVAVAARRGLSLFQVVSGKRLWQFEGRKEKYVHGAFTPDGRMFVAAGLDRCAFVWDIETGKLRHRFQAERYVPKHPFLLSQDGTVLAEKRVDTNIVRLWDTNSGKLFRALPHRAYSASGWAISPKGRSVVAINNERDAITVWESSTGRGELIAIRDKIHPQLSFSPCGTIFAAVSATGSSTLHIWNRGSARLLRTVSFKDKINAFALRCGGRTVAIGQKNVIRLIDISSGDEIARLPVGIAPNHKLCFTQDGKRIFAQYGAAIRIWDAATGNETQTPAGHFNQIACIASPSRGTMVATEDMAGEIRLWDSSTGMQYGSALRDRLPGCEVVLAPDGKTLATFDVEDWYVRVSDVDTREQIVQFKIAPGFVGLNNPGIVLALSSKKRFLAVTRIMSSLVRLHNLVTGRVTFLKVGAKDLEFSPDGAWFATSNWNDTRVWKIDNDEMRVAKHLPKGGSLVFSPDSKILATFDRKSVVLWELITHQPVFRFEKFKNLHAVQMIRDGSVLALETGGRHFSKTKRVDVWDVLTKTRIQRIHTPQEYFSGISFSPDGTKVLTGMNTTIVGWKIASVERTGLEVEMDSGHLEQLWQDLGGRNATRAFEAARRLRAAKEVTVAFLKQRLHPVPVERHPSLIADLGSRNFAVRQKAIKAFWQLGRTAGPALRAALQTNLTLEVHLRVHDLLEKIEKLPPTSDFLRHYRGITVLEQIGGDSAREHLATLAAGASEASLTKEAAASIRRLDERE